MLNENFYISLKKFFKDQNITQQQVAYKLGTSQAYVNSILTGRNPIGRQTAAKLSAAYGLSAAWLLTGEGEMLATSHGSVNHISIDAGSRINATGGSSVSNVGNVAQGTAADTTTVDKLIGVMTRQQEQMSHQQEQIDQLIQILKDKL
jgi:plasmid maintenance system antidote protein VapI